jgi:hypothetical protein
MTNSRAADMINGQYDLCVAYYFGDSALFHFKLCFPQCGLLLLEALYLTSITAAG